MSKQLYKNTRFQYEIKKFYNKEETILDIIVFGSSVKGKEKPNDIDLLVLFKDKKDLDTSYKLKKLLEKNFSINIEIVSKSYSGLFSPSFKAREAIIAEGYSIIQSKKLSEGFGYNSLMLFRYSLKGFNKSQRMRFYYSLYGRTKDQKGILKELKAKKFLESVILCPIENTEKIKEFFDIWKISVEYFPILIPIDVKISTRRTD